MSEEVKDFYEKLAEYANDGMSGLYPNEDMVKEFVNYIEQLQQEIKNLKEIEEEHRKLNGELREENKELKEKLNCKKIISSTMPESTEFVILTKADHERQQKDIELENIKLKYILNELESWLEENIKKCNAEYLEPDELIYTYQYEEVLDKLKELKESDE